MVQMFQFVVDTMDNYYQRKLLSIANNRLETCSTEIQGCQY